MDSKTNQRIECLHEDKLKELAQQPNTIVMKPTHDVIFEPWSPKELMSVLKGLQGFVIKNQEKPADEIRRLAIATNDKLKEFSEKYRIMFKRVTEPEVATDPKKMAVIFAMIDIKQRIKEGKIDENTAKAELSTIAINAVHHHTKDEPIIEEVEQS